MSEVKVNGKNMSVEAALELIKQPSAKVTQVGFELAGGPKKDIPPSSEGFAIPKTVIAELSSAMDRMGADRLVYTIEGSPYVMGRTIRVVLTDPSRTPKGRFARLLGRIGLYLAERFA